MILLRYPLTVFLLCAAVVAYSTHWLLTSNVAMQIDPKTIERLVSGITDVVHPLRIILFGSAARGEMQAGSDIDVLVVMPEGTHRRRTAQMLYRRMNGVGAPVDILVATPQDLENYGDNIGLIYRKVLQGGQEIYAA